jgi:DNA-binding response OmpR family regulator
MAERRLPRILIAEDTPQAAELLEVYLSEGSYDVRIAPDGEQALREVKEWSPDLVLLDVMMPRHSGFEVCKRLRADPATRGIGVIMVTALDQPSDVEKAIEAGAHDFLTKPIKKADLLARVSALLASKGETELDRTLDYLENVQKGPAPS